MHVEKNIALSQETIVQMANAIKKFQITDFTAEYLDDILIEDGLIKFIKRFNEDFYDIVDSIPLKAVNDKIEVLINESRVDDKQIEKYFKYRKYFEIKSDAVQEITINNYSQHQGGYDYLLEFVKCCKNLKQLKFQYTYGRNENIKRLEILAAVMTKKPLNEINLKFFDIYKELPAVTEQIT